MKRLVLILIGLCFAASSVAAENEAQNYWPQWRGPNSDGVAPNGDPPVEWSEDKNIRWKVELPGTGHATPIIWGDRVFVSVAVNSEEVAPEQGDGQGGGGGRRRGPASVKPTSHSYEVMSLDRKTGKVNWRKAVREELPHEARRPEGSWASPSAITDGENLYASFGSRGIYCFDLDGNLKWEKDIGDLEIFRGFWKGSSPALHGNTLVVNWDHEGDSFILAMDKKTGKELWRTAREEGTSWATPLIVEYDGKPQVVTGATNKVLADFGIEVKRTPVEGGILIEHTTKVYVIDPEGRPTAIFDTYLWEKEEMHLALRTLFKKS